MEWGVVCVCVGGGGEQGTLEGRVHTQQHIDRVCECMHG